MAPRPKFVATCDFQRHGARYAEGDPVPAGVADALARHGDRFVRSTTKRAQTAATPAEETTPDTTEESD